MESYKVIFENCNGIRVEETISIPWKMHERVKELGGECEVWFGSRRVNVNKIATNAGTTPWHER